MATSLLTKDAPQPLGGYSQGIKLPISSSLVFVSGQIHLQADGTLVSGTIGEETAAAIRNVQAVLKEASATLGNVIKSTIFITDMAHFSEVDAEYCKWFSSDRKPARSCVAVKQLPKGARVEIECIAVV